MDRAEHQLEKRSKVASNHAQQILHNMQELAEIRDVHQQGIAKIIHGHTETLLDSLPSDAATGKFSTF